MKQRAGWILMALMITLPSLGRAQLAPVGLPRGVLRLDFGGEFRHADSRFLDGNTEDFSNSFTTAFFDGSYYAPLRSAELAIGRIIGNAGYRSNVGSVEGIGLQQIGAGVIGGSYGLTSRLTLFVTVPIVQTRMQARIRYDSLNPDPNTLASDGVNPADPVFGSIPGRAQTAGFFTDFDAALSTLSSNINSGFYDGNPAQKAQAQDALAQGLALRGDLNVVFNNPEAPFVPLDGGTVRTAITDSIAGFQSTLGGLSVTGFSSLPAFAAARMTPTEFQNFISNPAGPIIAFPLEDVSRNRIGDVEGGVAFTLADRWNRENRPGGFRAAVEARMRFPTGLIDRSDDLIDLGTGSGHFAVGVAGTVDLGSGRFGLRLRGGFEHSFAASLDRRIAGPLQPLVPASRLRTIERQPGNLIDIAATPFFRLVPSLALLGGVRMRRHGQDQVTYANAADSIPGVSASVMEEGTDWTLTTFLAGVSYQSPAAIVPGQSGFPVEASWTIEGPLSSSRGLVAKERTMRFQVRLYTRLFD